MLWLAVPEHTVHHCRERGAEGTDLIVSTGTQEAESDGCLSYSLRFSMAGVPAWGWKAGRERGIPVALKVVTLTTTTLTNVKF